ncbi:hypothetical protein HMPREF0492_0317 [Lactobacillus acidophilus ATCC 4796]|nr:hypothetical protein HMPREF0492_0317 [Lactobacillus acidophilus ATCC 4796]
MFKYKKKYGAKCHDIHIKQFHIVLRLTLFDILLNENSNMFSFYFLFPQFNVP